MAVYLTEVVTDLAMPPQQRPIPHQFAMGDNNAYTITALLCDSRNPEAELLDGTVGGELVRPDGVTVALAGEKGDAVRQVNLAAGGLCNATPCSVTLPQACFAVPGRVTLTIKLTEGTTITQALSVSAVVVRTSTDEAVDPGEVIPDLAELQAAAAEALDAAEDARAAAAEASGLTMGASAYFAGLLGGSGTTEINRKRVVVTGNHIHMEGMGTGSGSGTYAMFNTLGTTGGISGTYSAANIKSLFTAGKCYTGALLFAAGTAAALRIGYNKQSISDNPAEWDWGFGLYTYDADTDTLTQGVHQYSFSPANGPGLREFDLSADFIAAAQANKNLALVLYGKSGAQWLSSMIDLYWEIIPVSASTGTAMLTMGTMETNRLEATDAGTDI